MEPTYIRNPLGLSHREFLPEKAVQLLDAARRVVDRDGADGLTLRAVAKVAGMPSSQAIYYFTSTAELEAMLLDSIWRDEVAQHIRDLDAPPFSATDRIEILVGFHSRIAQNLDGMRAYCELITRVIRDEATKLNVARIYEGYRTELNQPLLATQAHSESRSRANAAVMLAAGEGLPLGRLVGTTEEEMIRAFDLLAKLFRLELLGEAADQEATTERAASSESNVHRRTRAALRASSDLNPTSKRLIAAGLSLLYRGGLREVTLGNVAAASGEAKSLISYYFRSKQGYIDALVSELFREWEERLKRTFASRKPLTAASLTRGLFGKQSILVSAILLQPTFRQNAARASIAETAYAETIAALSELFETRHRQVHQYEAVTAATLFLSTLNGLALQSLYDPKGFELKPALEALLRLLPPRNASLDLATPAA